MARQGKGLQSVDSMLAGSAHLAEHHEIPCKVICRRCYQEFPDFLARNDHEVDTQYECQRSTQPVVAEDSKHPTILLEAPITWREL